MADSFDELDDDETLDLGLLETAVDETIEFNMQFSLLNHYSYDISVVHELDGVYDELLTTPQIAVEKAGMILYVLLTSGFFHRIRFEATEPGDSFHLKFIEATMYYQGQLS